MMYGRQDHPFGGWMANKVENAGIRSITERGGTKFRRKSRICSRIPLGEMYVEGEKNNGYYVL